MSDNGRIGVIDGTHPHPYVERLPGLREEILNTGMFWDRKQLVGNNENIRKLCMEKNRQYDRAYLYLRACGNLRAVINSYIEDMLDIDKMKACISRMMRGIGNGDGYKNLPALVNCIGMKGEAHLDTFEREADKIFVLRGDMGESAFLIELDKCLRDKGMSIRTAYHPIYDREIEGIFVEKMKYWFVNESALTKDCEKSFLEKTKYINMQRFIFKDPSKAEKGDTRYCRRLLDTCVQEAKKCLARAGEAHFELEEIYKSSMDFEALNAYMDESCREMFG
ncbi:MAG: hypothetical protein E7667_05085 [Ruminococcaceae bacterium]|nr:hypothetical protein [Oscillospiraceae bacterium]